MLLDPAVSDTYIHQQFQLCVDRSVSQPVSFFIYIGGLFIHYLVGLVIANATPKQEVLVSILGSHKVLLGFPNWNYNSHGFRICARLMAISAPPITWDLKT